MDINNPGQGSFANTDKIQLLSANEETPEVPPGGGAGDIVNPIVPDGSNDEPYYQSIWEGQEIDSAVGKILDGEISDARNEAVLAASNAAQSADEASQSADEAESSANTAKQYSGKPPKPQDGTWWIWNATTQQYVDSGISSTLTIKHSYTSVEAMNADFANTEENDLAIISGSTEDVDTAKLYIHPENGTQWKYLSDLSGIQGPPGEDGTSGKSAYQQAVEGGYTGTEAEFNAILDSLKLLNIDEYHLQWNGTNSSGKPAFTISDSRMVNAVPVKIYDTEMAFYEGGRFWVGDHIVSGISTPVQNTDAANKKFVEDTVANAVGSDIIQGTSVVIGPNTSAANNGAYSSTVIGDGAKDLYGYGSIAIGHSVKTNGFGAVALGSYAYAAELGSIAIGIAAAGCYFGSVAIGRNSVSSGSYSTAMGGNSRASGNYSIGIGHNAAANNSGSVAIGNGAASDGDMSIVIGDSASGSYSYSAAIGYHAVASAPYSIAIGCYAACYGGKCVAFGPDSQIGSNDWNAIQLGSTDLSALRCAVSLSVTSDIRDKTGVVPIEDGAIKLLEKITPISYFRNPRAAYIDIQNLSETDAENRRKFGLCEYDREAHAAGEKKGARRRVGVSAQQVQEALEEVYGSSDYANIVNDNLYDVAPEEIPNGVENQLTVSYEEFVPFLIKAVQELSSRVKELEGSKK